ncbi:hypothetical protein COLO4_29983 [Corchorus olitorius]|uniref:Uncharacterized protein n=1 Tax=Corchorus olitorius TaxID=93759 RepID=A0A1R3HBW9_9ROSI|nr:hypothetical protein COLO4_29983 [Corchorus olitorius]
MAPRFHRNAPCYLLNTALCLLSLPAHLMGLDLLYTSHQAAVTYA